MKIAVTDKDVLYGIEQVKGKNKDGKDVLKMLEKNSPEFYGDLSLHFVTGAKLKGDEETIAFKEELTSNLSLFRFGLATLYSAVKKEIRITDNKVNEVLLGCREGRRDSNLESELMRRIENINKLFAKVFGDMTKRLQLHGYSSYALALMLIAILDTIEESPKKKVKLLTERINNA